MCVRAHSTPVKRGDDRYHARLAHMHTLSSICVFFQYAGVRVSPHDQLDEQRAANIELLSRENVFLSLPELFVGEPPSVMRPGEIGDRRVDKDVV